MRYLLLLGGNVGDMAQTLNKAQSLIGTRCRIVTASGLYGSEAWGFSSADFTNQVVEVETDLTPIEMLDFTQDVEQRLGRKTKTTGRYEARPIDIDILTAEDTVIRTQRLTIPHPLISERRFALVPLCEHWAAQRLPTTGKSFAETLFECEDGGRVWPLTGTRANT